MLHVYMCVYVCVWSIGEPEGHPAADNSGGGRWERMGMGASHTSVAIVKE